MTTILVASVEDLIAACDGHETVGFHGTSSLACKEIEANGFLPSKVFSQSDHANLFGITSSLSIDTLSYKEWFGMRSVTFAKQANDAVSHVRNGSSGGQGLQNMQTVLQSVLELGDDQQKMVAMSLVEKLECIRKAPPVVYAVNLAGFGPRLVNDQRQPLYQYYWDPSLPVSAVSDIGPNRLIARLNLNEN